MSVVLVLLVFDLPWREAVRDKETVDRDREYPVDCPRPEKIISVMHP